jgi:hypothetical protein
VNLLYKRTPKVVLSVGDSADLGISDRYGHLLSLLVASYVWLDDEEDKAVYYKSLYDEEAARLERDDRSIGDSRIKDVLGWC